MLDNTLFACLSRNLKCPLPILAMVSDFQHVFKGIFIFLAAAISSISRLIACFEFLGKLRHVCLACHPIAAAGILVTVDRVQRVAWAPLKVKCTWAFRKDLV